eukprot:m51a1_g1558 hypothetical protein (667) ;mRNA; r:28795-31883
MKLVIVFQGQARTCSFRRGATVASAIASAVPSGASHTGDHILWSYRHARWFPRDDALHSLELESGEKLEVISRYEEIETSVCTECGQEPRVARVLVDMTAPTRDASAAAAQALEAASPHEAERGDYALYAGGLGADDEDGGELLAPPRPLVTARHVAKSTNGHLVLRRRFFFLDSPCLPEHDFYRVSEFIENGFFLCKKDKAITLAATMAQATCGDYSKAEFPDARDLKVFLPPQWRFEKRLKQAILKEYKALAGTAVDQARDLFVRTARSIPTFGFTCFHVQEGHTKGLTELFGVSANSVARFTDDGGTVLHEYPLQQVKKYGEIDNVSFSIGLRDQDEYNAWSTKSKEIKSLLTTYTEFQKSGDNMVPNWNTEEARKRSEQARKQLELELLGCQDPQQGVASSASLRMKMATMPLSIWVSGRYECPQSDRLTYRGLVGFPSGFQPSRKCHECFLQQREFFDRYSPSLLQTVDHCLAAQAQIRSKETASRIIEGRWLTDDEVLALIIYTAETGSPESRECNVYWNLNEALMRRSSSELHAWRDYLWYLMSALGKLPDYAGDVYRAHASRRRATDNFYSGREVFFSEFVSCTTDARMARRIAGPEGLVMKVRLRHGKAVGAFSLLDEGEVLILPNTPFVVTDAPHAVGKHVELEICERVPPPSVTD